MPKAFHPKSRKGCTRCKARKVKCDEVHPVCGACQRHGAKCEYKYVPRDSQSGASNLLSTHTSQPQELRPAPYVATPRSALTTPLSAHSFSLSAPGLPSPHPSVSPIATVANAPSMDDRHSSLGNSSNSSGSISAPGPGPITITKRDDHRILEMHLFYNYIENVCQSFLSPRANEVWRTVGSRLAFQHPFLLDAIMAFSALHLAKTHPDEAHWDELHTQYFSRAAEGQRIAVEHIDGSNAEAIMATTCLICDYAFFVLRGGATGPSPPGSYMLPLLWLRIARGTRPLYKQTHEWLVNGSFSHLVSNLPLDMTRDSLLFTAANREPFDQHARWEWDRFTIKPLDKDAYEKVFSYIGSIHFAMKQGEDPLQTCRRIMLFPMRIPERFLVLIESCQPRALAQLGHIFTLLKMLDPKNWWFDGVADTQVQGIESMLPFEWHGLLHLPLQDVLGTDITS